MMGLFQELKNLVGRALDPGQQYAPPLDGLRRVWAKNPVLAVLQARLRWQEIPPHLEARAANIIRAFDDHKEIQDAVNSQYMSHGLDPEYSSYSGPDPEEAMFMSSMGAARSTANDPEPEEQHGMLAEAVLTGRASALDMLMATAPPEHAAQLKMCAQLMSDIRPHLEKIVLLQCALVLPRARIQPILETMRGYA